MTTLIVILGALIYIGLYLKYGKSLEKNVVKATNQNDAPSKTYYDGVDYVPSKAPVPFRTSFRIQLLEQRL